MPVRQWVLSFPYEIRYRLAYDGEWVSKVLAVFLRVVGRWYRHQAQAVGHGSARWGSVTLVQRSGSSLNLNPHVHVLMLDGVYVDGKKAPVFVPAPPLSDPDVQQIVQTSVRRIIRLCTQHGLLDDTQADWLADEEPVLAALTAADCDSSAPPCGPARPGVCRRHQRLPGLWRSPAGRGRPDRSGLDPDLSGGGRAAGGAPAEGPASAAVRVRRLTSSAIRSLRRERYGGVHPQVLA